MTYKKEKLKLQAGGGRGEGKKEEGTGGGGRGMGGAQAFRGSGPTVSDTVMVDTGSVHVSKCRECAAPCKPGALIQTGVLVNNASLLAHLL